MSDLVSLFDALYSRLLLRDVFGKIVPGSVVILAFLVSVTSPKEVQHQFQKMPFWFWLCFLGAAWVLAFAIQAFGETTNLIRYYDKRWNDNEFYKMLQKFERCASPLERQQFERFVVIKEACGNGYLALAIAMLLIAVDFCVDTGVIRQICEILKSVWHIFGLMVTLTFFMARMHFILVKRQSDYMTLIAEPPPEKPTNEKSSNTAVESDAP